MALGRETRTPPKLQQEYDTLYLFTYVLTALGTTTLPTSHMLAFFTTYVTMRQIMQHLTGTRDCDENRQAGSQHGAKRKNYTNFRSNEIYVS